jgi:hypothetical protein
MKNKAFQSTSNFTNSEFVIFETVFHIFFACAKYNEKPVEVFVVHHQKSKNFGFFLAYFRSYYRFKLYFRLDWFND